MSELHRCEPYVYAQMIAGRDAAYPGEAKNSWLTGTAAWTYVAATLQAVMTLLYYIMIFTGGRRD